LPDPAAAFVACFELVVEDVDPSSPLWTTV
jgi:hypothetical protein